MNIKIKFFSSLMDYLPDNADGNTLTLDVNEQQTPNQILDRYKVPYEEAQMMMCNGEFLPIEERDKAMHEGDVLAIWPTIQGG